MTKFPSSTSPRLSVGSSTHSPNQQKTTVRRSAKKRSERERESIEQLFAASSDEDSSSIKMLDELPNVSGGEVEALPISLDSYSDLLPHPDP